MAASQKEIAHTNTDPRALACVVRQALNLIEDHPLIGVAL
jgi:hypothetical protein